eukprot:1796286-Alexandrium_andersonii.AAC.1
MSSTSKSRRACTDSLSSGYTSISALRSPRRTLGRFVVSISARTARSTSRFFVLASSRSPAPVQQ